jgi:hypothetical protein
VDLVKDEEWGRVLVALRDFQPGEVVVRSTILFEAITVAECIREYRMLHQTAPFWSNLTAQYIQWATSSSR